MLTLSNYGNMKLVTEMFFCNSIGDAQFFSNLILFIVNNLNKSNYQHNNCTNLMNTVVLR